MIAFEPGSCDRNRLRNLIGEEEFNKYSYKLIDFQRQLFIPIASTDLEKATSSNKLYVSGRAQWDIYPLLFLNNAKLEKKFEEILLPVDHNEGKCFTDVNQLCNLVKIWHHVLFSGISTATFKIINKYRLVCSSK